ncbi:beta-aspartyl peptidase [Clostridium baratii str. Sullivan]|uniref:Isoaspartyl dipeptidase n=1 Tax=Clostridium baratii str. Sullivan TaxID=1415775 RepID=A0A0A7FXK6_9CLOT|nr:beta-aspartyl-peptidase [Clostridium baratii]AIY83680.1 beta-aspartyl peptidase [Clostridium baratii str. Sullivan]
MIKVIKNIKVYSPEYMGIKDIVIVKDKIEGIYENIEIPNNFINIEIIDGKGKIAFPGFIDAHVHLTGGGGEGGFKTRTPELQLSTITKSGITTVVGCIGTDGVCRDMRGLVAKVKALKEEGITAYCLTGSYEVPVNTMTESIKGDIMLVDEVIGVGEIALSDNRSSQPRLDQFINLVAESRVGGLLANKSGIVNVHLGGGARRLNYLFEMLDESEIPATQLLPTHMCRTSELLEAGIEWTKRGGYIDLTTSSDQDHLEEGEVIASKALKYALDKEVPIEQITFTSDGNGSMPLFDESGKLKGLGICSVESLYREVKKSILEENIKIEDAIKVITSNIAHILKFKHKGKIERGMDADIVIVDDSNLNIDKVIAMGNIMVDGGEAKVLGTFEN